MDQITGVYTLKQMNIRSTSLLNPSSPKCGNGRTFECEIRDTLHYLTLWVIMAKAKEIHYSSFDKSLHILREHGQDETEESL